jgi:endonuclease-3 related protein
MTSDVSFEEVYRKLFNHYGPQHWWPAETPFEVMVGAVLTQNTAWSNVERAIENLKQNHCLAPESILDTEIINLAEWLRPSGYFNIKAKRLRNFCQWYVNEGQFSVLSHWNTEKLRKGLLSVNGVGPETADDILLYAFERPIFVIDAYTRRIFSRLGFGFADEGYEHLRLKFENNLPAETKIFNEYHALIVVHAKEACKKTPNCSSCCLLECCPSNES